VVEPRRQFIKTALAAPLVLSAPLRERKGISTQQVPIDASGTELLRLMHSKQVSPIEVVEACLPQIEATQKTVGAIVYLNAKQTRNLAKDAETRIRQGRHRSLEGLCLSVKDQMEIEGLPITVGCQRSNDVTCKRDATVVKRLRDQGVIFLATTNMPALGIHWNTTNSAHGQTNNPYDLDKTPGGKLRRMCGKRGCGRSSGFGGSRR